jgi:hypothetical protein
VRSRQLIAQLLAALEAGQVSVEEALSAAVTGPPHIGRLLVGAKGRHRSRPTFRRPKYIPNVVVDRAVASVRRRLSRLKGVTSVHWGVKEVHGRPVTDCAVIVHVDRKLSCAALRARGRKAVPRTVVVGSGRRRYRVPVDVQAARGPAHLHAGFVQPGDHGAIRRNGTPIGALGAIANGAAGAFAITAGHVAGLLGPGSIADCLDDEAGAFPIGSVRLNRFTEGIDIAAIGPVAAVPKGATLDPTFARDVTNADARRRVTLMLPGTFTPVESHIAGVDATRGFQTPVGIITMSGLTTIGRVTQEGDSGAPALDDAGAVIGFVIGSDASHTYLLPARRALDALDPLL